MTYITLLSDWQEGSYYMGALKGRILSNNTDCTIIDLNNSVSSHNLSEALFILRNSYTNFPKGSIHCICVNTTQNGFIYFSYEGHHFIGPNTGAWGLLFGETPATFYDISQIQISELSFPELSVYPLMINKITNNDLESILSVPFNIELLIPLRAAYDEHMIRANILYIDSYKNIITNVSKELFDRLQQNRTFEITIKTNHYKITKISETYNNVDEGELVAIFNSCNLLEIAMNNGELSELLGIDRNSSILIKFK